eukprot:715076-Pelagomonas_calceolata.AAC.1
MGLASRIVALRAGGSQRAVDGAGQKSGGSEGLDDDSDLAVGNASAKGRGRKRGQEKSRGQRGHAVQVREEDVQDTEEEEEGDEEEEEVVEVEDAQYHLDLEARYDDADDAYFQVCFLTCQNDAF